MPDSGERITQERLADINHHGALYWWNMCGRLWEMVIRLEKENRELRKRLT